jgi:ABC-type amino acid transport substrate-binding protein
MMKKAFVLILTLYVVIYMAGCGAGVPPNTVYSAADLEGRQIGVVLNSAATTYAAGKGTVHEYTTGETMLVDLRNGALDCAVMDDSIARPLLQKVRGLRILSKPLLKSDFRIAIAKENPDLTKDINKALKELGDEGVLARIVGWYLNGEGDRYAPAADTDRSAGTLTLAVDSRFPPYAYDDGQGNIVGIDIDVARAVCDRLHVDMKITVFDSSSLITSVEFGKADLALGGLTDDDSDKKLVDMSNTYVTCTQVIVTRK